MSPNSLCIHVYYIHIQMVDTMMEIFGDAVSEYVLNSTEEEERDLKTAHSSLTLDRERIASGLRSLFLHHLLQLRCNSHSVTAVEVERKEEGERGGGRGGEVVQSTREVQLGSAVFPTASLFNHSCWPNVIFRYIINFENKV